METEEINKEILPEVVEQISEERLTSIIESIFFSTDKPQSIANIKQAFKGTDIDEQRIKRALEVLRIDYEDEIRGFTLEKVGGSYQLRTKEENTLYIKRMIKARNFRLSGPSLEVLSIVAYKQPCIKVQIDEVRGIESGHLLRSLMDRGLIAFSGKSELPGKPMLYKTTRKFLEIFSLENLGALPSLSEIDQLIPEGIGDEKDEESLEHIGDMMSNDSIASYSENEQDLDKISCELSEISTTSDFFEKEKQKMRLKKQNHRAQDIREALVVNEEVSEKDRLWLEKYEANMAEVTEIGANENNNENKNGNANENAKIAEADDN